MKIKIFNYTIKISKNRSKYSKNLIREASKKVWSPPSSLDAPRPKKGFVYRWIRSEIINPKVKNITGTFREGYELVRPTKYQARKYPTIDEGKYKGCIGVGGLVLARIPIQKIKRLGT